MADAIVHRAKYQAFKQDAERAENSIPLRVKAYFLAAFHAIELVMAEEGLHIGRPHQVQALLESNASVKGKAKQIWRDFQQLDKIRLEEVYGPGINGKNLKKAQRLFEAIEKTCLEILGEESSLQERP